jgi:hypothetical protein
MAKAGRKPWIPPDPEVVKKMAANGLSEKNIAAALGISQETLIKKKKEYAEFSEALKEGRALGELNVTNHLMAAVKAGSVRAMEIYLKCRCGWKETNVLELPPDKKLEEMTDEELLAIIQGRKI